jgi:protein kinase C substrate 80K-H
MKYLIVNFLVVVYFCSNSLGANIQNVNSTYFMCDSNKTLHISNLNDDYCDCLDGTDENITNACVNGKFVCKNYPYHTKEITTAKVIIF